MRLASVHILPVMALTIHPSFAAGVTARFVGLGDSPGGLSRSEVRAVSADGKVAVGTSYSAAGARAFRWTLADGMAVLGDEPAHGFDVSADGSVVVGSTGHDCFVPGAEAFRWTRENGLVRLGRFPAEGASQANGVSANGDVVVGVSRGPGGGCRAFRWTESTGMTCLDNRSDTNQGSDALSVAADGRMVVGSAWFTAHDQDHSSRRRAFYWETEQDLVTSRCLVRASVRMPESLATDVTPDGGVIVGVCESSADKNQQAFRWRRGRGRAYLGLLPGGISYSKANAVSEDGALVVGTSSAKMGFRAFLWDEAHGMQVLQELLTSAQGLGSELKGWRLLSAEDISANGEVIVGRGVNPKGDLEAWIAVVPRRL